MSNDDPRFFPSANQPQPPSGWLPYGGGTSEHRSSGALPPAGQAWGPEASEQQLWADEPKRNWFMRHKVLTGVGGGALGVTMLLCMVGAVASAGASESPESPAAVSAEPIVNEQPAEQQAAEAAAAAQKAAADKAAADKTAAKKAAADKDAAVKKAAAEKAAAAKAAADKKAAQKKAAAEKKAAEKRAKDKAAEEQRASLPVGTDCKLLAEEAVRISRESNYNIKVIKIRSLRIVKDKRETFTIPRGDRSTLVLSCRGQAATSDGAEGQPVLVKMTVDADSDYFIGYNFL
ncbi:hypothetical protein OWR29_07155 [Actinoplanes sp. Pm04-4]|uniref:Uncharacterized protein n=1 Tax=Paractinoplanes pyxinae TaxID=2997416 RepID=A0ABT4AVA2_9ACTN|nr:hypothetical protein [Actinoplanes pyxinae]MCY1137772.1 hypothetical protein [Actinoplanes pyxinae]